jgi:lipoate-protein ligase A
MSRPWRLIVTDPAPGAWNMALDEALSETLRQGGDPFLRFYFWEPGALSLGRFQNPLDGLSEESRSVPRVRRPTGGGGIWHADELTYSLACLQEDLDVRGVKPSFERLCGFLLEAWNRLGWHAQFAKDISNDREGLGAFTPACFAGQEEYDILIAGKKLGGNAQRRDREILFQHGSLPLTLDWTVLEHLFLTGFRPDPAKTTDLRTCGWKGTGRDLIPLLVESFQGRMGVEWKESRISPEEQHRAETLVRERFGNPSWTENGGGSLRGA